MGTERARNSAVRNKSGNGGNENTSGKSEPEVKESASGTEKRTGTEPGTVARTGTQTGTEKRAGTKEKADNKTVNPTDLEPDDIYERDEQGNIVYRADGVTPRRKRGRKKGAQSTASVSSASKPKRAKSGDNTVAVEMLAAQFQILNTGLAFLTKFDDFKLDDSEAMQMAEASALVMEQFDYTPDPKVAAVLGLVTTTSMIYGPRVYLYRKHIEKKRKEKREQQEQMQDERAVIRGPMNMSQFTG